MMVVPIINGDLVGIELGILNPFDEKVGMQF